MNPLGIPFIELNSVDSTNNYALTQLHAGLAQHGTAFFSHEQVAGKGQRGKTWTVGLDEGVILSVVINPESLAISRQFELSACIAISVREWFSRFAGDETYIKWPNDLYWQDRKAGGILIENLTNGYQWRWAVAGIGININQGNFPSELKNPVSLRQITGKQFDTVDLAKELCQIIERNFQKLLNSGFEGIHYQYNQYLYKRNSIVKIKRENRTFEVLIKGVSTTGLLQTRHAIDEDFGFGEIEWIIPPVCFDPKGK